MRRWLLVLGIGTVCYAEVLVPRGTRVRVEVPRTGSWVTRTAVTAGGSVVVAAGASVGPNGETVQAIDGTLIPLRCEGTGGIRDCVTTEDHAITAPSRESVQETVTQPTSIVESTGSNAGDTALIIMASERGASVELDRKYMGDAPLTLAVRPGSHRIVVRGNGKTWVRTIDVPFGARMRINAELKAR